jgi:HAD superfamily hydrolase (TIGR01490 family)
VSSAAAAFFDLDKTIIAKSSALAFGKPFRANGLINRRAVVKAAYAQFMFMISGADAEQMDRLRDGLARAVTGWPAQQVRDIVAETLHEIVEPLIYAEAAALIAKHKAKGHAVVIVSSSGAEVVGPIGAMLGADEVVATRLVEDAGGHYTGDIEFYAYGANKAAAVRELAERRGWPLDDCFAYSDSITDLPMLEAVGHPTVVNPDRALRREATGRDWPVLTFSRPVSLRDRINAPSGAAVATSVAVGASALAAGALTYSLLRRFLL